MATLLVSHQFGTDYGTRVAAARDHARAELLALPPDPVDELHPPQALRELLPRCDWLIIACPLTPEDFGAFIRTEIENYANVIRIAGLRQQ